MNAVEFIAFLSQFYDNAYYYIEKVRQTIQTATLGKRDMVCLKNGCWIEASYNIPESWIEWKYNSEKHELMNVYGPSQSEPLGWLSVIHDNVDISYFFASLRCGQSENTKYFPTDAMFISVFALQSGWMPRGKLTIILADASEKIIDCSTLFSIQLEADIIADAIAMSEVD